MFGLQALQLAVKVGREELRRRGVASVECSSLYVCESYYLVGKIGKVFIHQSLAVGYWRPPATSI